MGVAATRRNGIGICGGRKCRIPGCDRRNTFIPPLRVSEACDRLLVGRDRCQQRVDALAGWQGKIGVDLHQRLKGEAALAA